MELLPRNRSRKNRWPYFFAGVVETESDDSDEAADPSLVTRVLDSSDRAPAFRHKIEAILTDPHRRDDLRKSLEHTLEMSRELISRWGAVLTGSSSFSELFDRHVEMIGRIDMGLGTSSHTGRAYKKPVQVTRRQRATTTGSIDNLLSMTRIAIRLDDETWALALRVVPPEWWDKRTDELAAPAHAATP